MFIDLHVVSPNDYEVVGFEIPSVCLNIFMCKKKLHGLSPRANYTDRATAASRRSVANLCG
jgi:hypothetical protein